MENKKPNTEMTVIPKLGEQHPGQTAEQGPTHDQKGSQIEAERHQYPNNNIPKTGSVRSNKRLRITRSVS